MKNNYKKALRLAVESIYISEVVETGMEENTIGEEGWYSSKEEWIEERMKEFLDEANNVRPE